MSACHQLCADVDLQTSPLHQSAYSMSGGQRLAVDRRSDEPSPPASILDEWSATSKHTTFFTFCLLLWVIWKSHNTHSKYYTYVLYLSHS